MHLTRARPIDPFHRRAVRFARVAIAARLDREVLPARRLGELARIVGARGLNVRMLHALHACATPERVALVDGRRSLTYAEADREINRLAHALRDRFPLRRGDAAILALENRSEYLIAWFALMRLGVRAVHAGAHATAAELLHVAATTGARVAFVSEATIAAAPRARDAAPERALRLVGCGPLRLDEARDAAYDDLVSRGEVSFPEDDGRPTGESVVFTSGTTGAPKGALRDFGVFGPRELVRVLERLPFAFGDRHLLVGPLHHSAPQVMALLHTALGGTIVMHARFDAARALTTLSTERIHSVFLVPTMLRRILELPAEVHAATPTPELRAVVVGSSEFPEELRRAAIARFGPRAVFDFYGATELGWVTTIRGDEMRRKPGSVGRPLAGQEIRVVDEQGRDCPRGAPGRIYVKNEQTMVGYVRDGRVRAEAVSDLGQAGWSTVDDVGWLDEDGYLFLSGRARDMVKSGGVNVYPAEVERVLAGDPSIREVAVIGVPDREWGERVVAVVVPREGRFDAREVEARAREQLSPAKVPRRWEIVPALPRNENGKVLKAELRARFAAPAA